MKSVLLANPSSPGPRRSIVGHPAMDGLTQSRQGAKNTFTTKYTKITKDEQSFCIRVYKHFVFLVPFVVQFIHSLRLSAFA
jgi:hypothetical protein